MKAQILINKSKNNTAQIVHALLTERMGGFMSDAEKY